MSEVVQKFEEVQPGRQIFWFRWTPPSATPPFLSWDKINGKPSTFPPSEHNHDDRYYRKDEVDALIPTITNITSVGGWWYNAVMDEDGTVGSEPVGGGGDGEYIAYEPGTIYDNPPVPIRHFDTLADLKAVTGWELDRATIRRFYADDDPWTRSEWMFLGDPTLVANGADVHALDSGIGFVKRVAVLT